MTIKEAVELGSFLTDEETLQYLEELGLKPYTKEEKKYFSGMDLKRLVYYPEKRRTNKHDYLSKIETID